MWGRTKMRAESVKRLVIRSFYASCCYALVLGGSLAIFAQSALAQPFFESTWATALGQSDNAIRDGGNWDAADGNGDYVNVKRISGPGLPTELANLNMATVSMNGSQGWQSVGENVNTNTASDFYYRFYLRVKPTIGFQYGSLHPWQDFQDLPGGLSTNFYIGISSVNTTTWRPAFWTYAQQEAGVPDRFGVYSPAFGGPAPADQLQVNRWYRIEGHIRYLNRVSSGGAFPYAETIYNIRIYNDQNQQVLSNEDFTGELCNGSGCTYNSLQSYYNQGHRFRFRATSSTFTMGTNGPATATGQGEIYDMTAMAFSNTGWIGAYGGAGGGPSDTQVPAPPRNLQVN